jgi:hypothetical protein
MTRLQTEIHDPMDLVLCVEQRNIDSALHGHRLILLPASSEP